MTRNVKSADPQHVMAQLPGIRRQLTRIPLREVYEDGLITSHPSSEEASETLD